jgi:2-iminobutanoate/2-iminopropanoate deaminase
MSKRVIRTQDAPAPVGPYNQAIAVSGGLSLGKFPLMRVRGRLLGLGM